ncbi:hypothetical protein DFR50_110122 [Roseiarcus fermentans]|uniref:Uncharacterized protein n=1 Tax=Roseiarcus fermentans TaxID=1473586 RepID=A0A366FHL6_9HYPH|nr:hypothetical protein [Roseiarcus fermentans]RBP14097.1 hypothetical protein DFR50_110122 [Roseiarcus fermentans]
MKRKAAARALPKRDDAAGEREADGPGRGVASREALDVASYISDMTAQLEAMALAAGLDLLGYFLGMARSEADMFVRTNESDEDDHGLDGLADEGQAAFGGPEDED